jgi:hypothetical protein
VLNVGDDYYHYLLFQLYGRTFSQSITCLVYVLQIHSLQLQELERKLSSCVDIEQVLYRQTTFGKSLNARSG